MAAKSTRARTASLLGGGLLFVGTLSFAFHAGVLGFFFTGGDTLPLIETSRIESVEDVGRTFGQPLMDGTSFVDLGRFYRPVSRLSFALDYSLWGLDPFGYNLTSVILHVLASLLVLFCVRSLTSGDAVASTAAGALMALSPAAVQVVECTEQRQDSLATVLVLLTLLLFSAGRRPERPRGWASALSVGTFALALGAKEIAVVGVGVLGVLAWARREPSPLRRRAMATIREIWPHLLVVLGWVLLRLIVLGSLGGYLTWPGEGPAERLEIALVVVFGYFAVLLVPWVAEYLHEGSGLAVGLGAGLVAAATIATTVVLLRRRRPLLSRGATREAVLTGLAGTLFPLGVYLSVSYLAERLMYLPAAFLSMLLGVGVSYVVQRTRSLVRRRAARGDERDAQVGWPGRGVVVAVLVAVPLTVVGAFEMRGGGALRAYSEVARRFLHRCEDALEVLPGGSRLVLHNTAVGADGPRPSADELGSLPRSLERSFRSWVRLRFPDRSFRVDFEDGGLASAEWGRPVAFIPTGGRGVLVLYAPGESRGRPSLLANPVRVR